MRRLKDHHSLAALTFLLLSSCTSSKIDADFTAVELFMTFPTKLGIDRLNIQARRVDDGSEALMPNIIPITPMEDEEEQTESINLFLQEELDRVDVRFIVEGAKEAGVIASGEQIVNMRLGLVLSATVALEVTSTCGDGLVDPAEACDDQNERSGDGCSDCAREAGFTCLGSPSECFVEARTAVVEQGAPCPGQGTHDSPFCALSSGIVAPWASTVAVRAGQYEERIVIDRDLELIGASGAVLSVAAAPAIRIEGAVSTVRGFQISGDSGIGGGIAVEGPDAMVEIRNNELGPGNTIGIDVGAGSFVRVEKNVVRAHAGGALRLATELGYVVRNNVFLGNGNQSSDFGGAWIEQAPANSVFANNTLAQNMASTATVAGLRCDPAAEIVNSIIWDQPSHPGCALRYSDVGPVTDMGNLGEGSFSADPLLDDQGRLGAGSPCIDAGDPASISEGTAPIDDLDGDGRPLGVNIDVGADERE